MANLENIEDDLQLRLDHFFDRLTIQFNKEIKLLKEVDVRKVCVDYPQEEASVVQGIYKRLVKDSFEPENLKYYLDKWLKSLLDLSV